MSSRGAEQSRSYALSSLARVCPKASTSLARVNEIFYVDVVSGDFCVSEACVCVPEQTSRNVKNNRQIFTINFSFLNAFQFIFTFSLYLTES